MLANNMKKAEKHSNRYKNKPRKKKQDSNFEDTNLVFLALIASFPEENHRLELAAN